MRRWAALLAAGLALAAPGPASAQGPPGLQLGFLDGAFSAPAAARDPWLQRAVQAGAGIVRIDVGWPVAGTPAPPDGFAARDPADPHYDFSRPDDAIRAASAAGLRVLASFTGAPRWAEGPGRPADAPPGSWRPDPQAIGDYGAALAARYSGGFADPQDPSRTLPRVAAFQMWNEPNLGKYLSPQWSGRQPASPDWYRRMLDAFYGGVKSAAPDALVVTAGTAPFGDPQPGGDRMMPARFVRGLLCEREVGGRLRRAGSCPHPARFDVLAHHPYSVGGPTRSALNADDVSIPDLGRLTRVLREAERAGTALPRATHALWITEVSYDSSPPDPDGVPLATHARWLQEALFELWDEGASAVFWFQVGDQAPLPSYATTNQSGVYFRDGRAKAALQAYRFPFVVRRHGGRLTLWGRAPADGPVVVERRAGSSWRPWRTFKTSAGKVFFTHTSYRGDSTLRARAGNTVSLTG